MRGKLTGMIWGAVLMLSGCGATLPAAWSGPCDVAPIELPNPVEGFAYGIIPMPSADCLQRARAQAGR